MEVYLDQFHRMKDIFLEFRVSKEHRPRLTSSAKSYNISEPKTTSEWHRPSRAGASKTIGMRRITSVWT